MGNFKPTARSSAICGSAMAAMLAITALQIPQAIAHNSHHPKDETIVETRAGFVRGKINNKGVREFLGIPYAKPPVGNLRWANPQPAASWRGVRDARQYGDVCAQNKRLGDFAKGGTSEDCLYLNVFAPKSSKGKKRPVMVWIHGGGLFLGHSDGHDGSALVNEQDVVVVTINYRLNVFGLLVHPALDGGGKTANYGQRDQQLALKWVKDNIDEFGGDPKNVTIFGESGGGLAVMLQVISPTASGLFHKAIVQSGAYTFWTGLRSFEDSRTVGRNFATAAGCPGQTAECLRGLSVEAILALEATAGMAPSLDGHVHVRPIKESLETGKFNRVPIFNGTTHDEYVWFQAFAEINTGHVITPDEYPARLAASFGANAAAVEQAYPLSAYNNSAGLALGAATSDNLFICPARNLNLAASKYVPTYGYEFNDPNSPGVLPPVSFPLLASHTHEIQYVFRGWKGVFEGEVTPFTPGQKLLSKRMVDYWATFARKGEPHEDWPRFSKRKELVVSLEVPKPVVINDFKQDHHCALWDSFR